MQQIFEIAYINVTKELNILIIFGKTANGCVAYIYNVSVRERFLKYLFGNKQKLTIIVPGDTVRELAISEVKERKMLYGRNPQP